MASYPKKAHKRQMVALAVKLTAGDSSKTGRHRRRRAVSIPGSYIAIKSEQPDDRPVLDKAGIVIRRAKKAARRTFVLRSSTGKRTVRQTPISHAY